jgi:AmmeMemoRadiSam system protein A
MSSKLVEEGSINPITPQDRKVLLSLAYQALDAGVRRQSLAPLNIKDLPPRLVEYGASFVTLTCNEQLRGCVGSLEFQRPLAEDVRFQAVAAARNDFRFPPVGLDELPGIKISISVLSNPIPIQYTQPKELLTCLRPNVDGVVLKYGLQRATFLPQVWEKIPDIELFLSLLCQKMGVPAKLWQMKLLEVLTFQVEEIHE